MEKTNTQQENATTKEQLIKERDAFAHRLFYMMFEFVVIFGVPAAAAVYFGKQLDAGTGKTWTVTLTVAAFILSWAVAIMRIKKVTGTLKALDDKIKALD